MKRKALAETLSAFQRPELLEVLRKSDEVFKKDKRLTETYERWKMDYLVRKGKERAEDLFYLTFFLAFVYDLNPIGYYYETIKGLSAYDVLNFLSYLEEITKKMERKAGNITYIKAKQVAQDFVNFVRKTKEV